MRGGVIAGLLFLLPGALIVFALSWIYILYGHLPLAASMFLGVKAAVVAFIFDALLRIGRKAMKARSDAIIAVAAFAALSLVAGNTMDAKWQQDQFFISFWVGPQVDEAELDTRFAEIAEANFTGYMGFNGNSKTPFKPTASRVAKEIEQRIGRSEIA